MDPASTEVGPLHPALADVFDALERASLAWCLLRFPDDLTAPAGDIDVLVARNDLRELADLLAVRGFVELPPFDRGHSFVRYDVATDSWLWLDVATELSFGDPPIQTGAADECLSRRRWTEGAWLLHPNDHFWMLLLRAALDQRSLTASQQTRLQMAARDARGADGAIRRFAQRRMPSSWTPERVVEVVAAGDWVQIDNILRGLRDAAGGTSLRHRLRRAATAFDVRRRIPTRHRRGLGVALIGPDGAGKTTLAAGLDQSLLVPARIVYMGVWRTPRLIALFGAPGRVGHAIAIQWLRWFEGAYHRSRGRFVIFDRYTEVHLEPAPRPDRIGRLLQRLRALAACPPPDLVLILDAAGTTAFARKHEQSPEEMERVRQRYLSVAGHFPRVAIINAEDAPDIVRRHATDAVWSAYRQRLAPTSSSKRILHGRSSARPHKILIVGGEATGKTTLARELAASLGYPEYELDEIAWQSTRGPDVSLRGVFEPDFQDSEPLVQRPLQDRLSRIRAIAVQPNWIAEGVFLMWTDMLFQQADAIIWLDQVGIVPIVGRILARHARSAYREIGLREGREKFTRIRDYARAIRQLAIVFSRVGRFHYGRASVVSADDYAGITRRAVEAAVRPHQAKLVHVRTRRGQNDCLKRLTGPVPSDRT